MNRISVLDVLYRMQGSGLDIEGLEIVNAEVSYFVCEITDRRVQVKTKHDGGGGYRYTTLREECVVFGLRKKLMSPRGITIQFGINQR